MLDFDKLRDPVWQAKVRAEEEAQQAALEAKEKQQRKAVDDCLAHYDGPASDERSLVSSCRYRLASIGIISEKQERWLFAIAKRVSEPGAIRERSSNAPSGALIEMRGKPRPNRTGRAASLRREPPVWAGKDSADAIGVLGVSTDR